MNVMIYNKYKDLLMGLNIEVMKSLEGVYNVDEIIDTFTNFYYDKMILDITAIRDYQNTDNLQKLAMNINMENVILLLDNSPEMDSKAYLSKLISLGIYNFTKNAEGINYLLVHPHTYRDVVNINNPGAMAAPMPMPQQQSYIPQQPMNDPLLSEMGGYSGGGKTKIIGFKNITNHAGATTLIYMLKKQLEGSRTVCAIEVNKVDFLYFNDKNMVSSNSNDVLKDIMRHNSADVILLDLNDYTDVDICTQVIYLLEPSTIMVNKMIKKNRNVLDMLRRETVVLNKCVLNNEDISTFEYETKLKVTAAIPPVDDRQAVIAPVKKFAHKIGLM